MNLFSKKLITSFLSVNARLTAQSEKRPPLAKYIQ